MRGLKMARGSPLGKGAGTGVKWERRMERRSRFFVFDILLSFLFEGVNWEINLNVKYPNIFLPSKTLRPRSFP